MLDKVENLEECRYSDDYGDKELKSKYFKLKLKYISYEIDKKLFKKIFGHTLETLAIKLLKTKNKEKNKITVNNINKNKEKLYEYNKKHNYVIQPSNQHNNLIDAINLIIDFNETI